MSSYNEVPEPSDGLKKSDMIRATNEFLGALVNKLTNNTIPAGGPGYALVALLAENDADSGKTSFEVELLSVIKNGSSGEDVARAISEGAEKAKSLPGRIVSLIAFGQLSTKKAKPRPKFTVSAMIIVDPWESDAVLSSSREAPVNKDGRICGPFEFPEVKKSCPILTSLAQVIFAPDTGDKSLSQLVSGINGGSLLEDFHVPGDEIAKKKPAAVKRPWAGKVRFSDN